MRISLTIWIIICLILNFGCRVKNNKINEDFFNPINYKFKNINNFSIDTNSIKGLYRLSVKEVKCFIDTSYNSKDSSINRYYLYSLQNNSDSLKAIIVYLDYELCCQQLDLLTYDKNNNLKQKIILSDYGFDAGTESKGIGKFLNDSIFGYSSYQKITLSLPNDLVERDSIVFDTLTYSYDKYLNFTKRFQKTWSIIKENK